MKIYLWFGNIFNFKGGIQTYGAFLLEAMCALKFGDDVEIFIKHDRDSNEDSIGLQSHQFHYAGNVPSRLRTPGFALMLTMWSILYRPQLIIAGHLNFILAAYLLKRFLGIPYWTIAHGIEAWDIQNPYIKTALHHADRILAVSNYTRDRLLAEQKLDPQRVVILPNTFDAHRFQLAPKPAHLLAKYRLTPTQPIVLTVARLAEVERYKGYDLIIAALPAIRQAIPDVHYIIVGQGDDRPRIDRLIQQLNLQDCVTLAGFIPDPQLCDYYNLCDLFAMPSKREGFGIVYLEALACGKPTLGGNQDGAIDALCDGELGALVNPDDIDEIAQTSIQILQGIYPHPLMYQPAALRQRVIDIYGFERFKQTLADILPQP